MHDTTMLEVGTGKAREEVILPYIGTGERIYNGAC